MRGTASSLTSRYAINGIVLHVITALSRGAEVSEIFRFNIALFALLMCMSGCKPDYAGSGFYTRIAIGPDETMQPEGERSLSQPSQLSFFYYLRGAYLASATHFVRNSQSAPPHIAFYLESDLENGKLDRTVKTTQVLQGDFGNVSLKKTCFYHRSFDTNLDTIAIGRYDGEAEPAERLVGPPMATKIPASFALLRVYRDGDGDAVLTGNYEANGMLRSLHLDHTRSGARLFRQNDGTYLDPSSPLQMTSAPKPAAVGLPLTLNPVAPIHFLRLPAAPLPVVTAVFFTSYGDGDLLREDMLAETQSGTAMLKETHYLRPPVVDEQRQLEPSCNAQLAKQRAAQKRTVE